MNNSIIVSQVPREICDGIQRKCQDMAKKNDEICENWVDWDLYLKMTPEQQNLYWKTCHELVITISAHFNRCTIICVPNHYRGPSSCNCTFRKTEEDFLKDFRKSMNLPVDVILSPEWEVNLLPTTNKLENL